MRRIFPLIVLLAIMALQAYAASNEHHDDTDLLSSEAPAPSMPFVYPFDSDLFPEQRQKLVAELCHGVARQPGHQDASLAEPMINGAWLMIRSDRAAHAIDLFLMSILQSQELPDAYLGMAAAGLALGYGDDLIGTCSARAESFGSPASADSYVEYGGELYRHGRLEDAIELFKRALELDPEHMNAVIGIHIVYTELGQADEARTYEEMLDRLLEDR